MLKKVVMVAFIGSTCPLEGMDRLNNIFNRILPVVWPSEKASSCKALSFYEIPIEVWNMVQGYAGNLIEIDNTLSALSTQHFASYYIPNRFDEYEIPQSLNNQIGNNEENKILFKKVNNSLIFTEKEYPQLLHYFIFKNTDFYHKGIIVNPLKTLYGFIQTKALYIPNVEIDPSSPSSSKIAVHPASNVYAIAFNKKNEETYSSYIIINNLSHSSMHLLKGPGKIECVAFSSNGKSCIEIHTHKSENTNDLESLCRVYNCSNRCIAEKASFTLSDLELGRSVFKQALFLTNSLLLACTKKGNLYKIVLNEKERKSCVTPQLIKSSFHTNIQVKKIVMDMYCRRFVLMIIASDQLRSPFLVLIDVVTRKIKCLPIDLKGSRNIGLSKGIISIVKDEEVDLYRIKYASVDKIIEYRNKKTTEYAQ